MWLIFLLPIGFTAPEIMVAILYLKVPLPALVQRKVDFPRFSSTFFPLWQISLAIFTVVGR